jgi:aminoglycoside 6'-N-acetyltransferase I
MDKITVRRAVASDNPEWLRMRQVLWPDEIEHLSFREMDAILADPMMPVFVAVRPDGRLGGFLEAGTRKYAEGGDSSPVGYIEGWFVDADLREHGVGRALVQAAEEWAHANGLQEMGSDTWLDNEISIKAHKKLGYDEVERLVHFLKKF